MTNLNYIDNLPTDILLECAKYICLPPIKLLKEIEHYGELKYSIYLLNNYEINNLIKIHYELLNKWYNIYASLYINELNMEHESVCDIIFTYSKKERNKVLINFIKKIMMTLPSNISNNIIAKYSI
jgi:hypothetical protein